MKRAKAIYKAIGNLGLNARVCRKCSGTGKWVFFKNTGTCKHCFGLGMTDGNPEIYKQITDYIECDCM